MENLIINDQEIKLEVEGDQILTTSLQIADVFEKEHKHILAKIDGLPQDDFRWLNFKPSSEVRKNGIFEKDTRYYKNLKRRLYSFSHEF